MIKVMAKDHFDINWNYGDEFDARILQYQNIILIAEGKELEGILSSLDGLPYNKNKNMPITWFDADAKFIIANYILVNIFIDNLH